MKDEVETVEFEPIPLDPIEMQSTVNYIVSLRDHGLIENDDLPHMARIVYGRDLKPRLRVITACELHLYKRKQRRAA